MFNNIGKKIMTLAKVLFWAVSAIFVVAGIIMMVAGGSYSSMVGSSMYSNVASAGTGASIIAGVLVIVFGVLTAWLSNLGLYAFGQLVDDTHAIRSTKETVD